MELDSLNEKGSRRVVSFHGRPPALDQEDESPILRYQGRSELREASSHNSPVSNGSKGQVDRYVHGWKLCVIITSLCLGTFLVALDVAIIGVAIPRITTEFHTL